MAKVIDATLRFVDKFTSPMSNAVKSMERSSKQAQRMGKEIQNAGNKISNVGSGLTVGLTTPIAAAGVACFEMASDMQESVNKVDVAFGDNSKEVKDWSETTLTKFGMAQATALDMASTYGDMATGMGLNTSEASKMAQSLVGLAGDLSSFKNISSDVAKTALNGVFTGETESLKQLGIVMTQTNLLSYAQESGFLKGKVSADKLKAASTKVEIAQGKLAKAIKKYGTDSLEAKTAQASLNTALEKQQKVQKGSLDSLSEAEKVQLRYNYVLDKTKNSQGDFARTSDGAANQQRMFGEAVKEVGATMGTKLLPIGTKLLTFANKLMTKFGNLNDEQQNTVLKVLGIVAAIGPAVFIVGKLTTGVGKAVSTFGKIGGAIKKAGSVMGLFTSPAFIVVAVIAAIAVGAFLLIKNWDKVKLFFGKFGTFLKGIFVKSGGSVSKFGQTFSKVKENVSKIVTNLRSIVGSIVTFMKPIVSFVSKVFVAGFKVGFSMIGGYISATVTGIVGAISGLLTIFNGITTFISGIFTGNWSKAWEGVKTIFGGIFESFAALVKTPVNAVIGIINNAISGINKLGLKIPKWVPFIGGKNFTINVPTIPMLAKGTNYWQGGLAMTQERGGEIMDLPRGTRVYPHDKSIQMARSESAKASGSVVVNINKLADKIEVRNDKDIDSIVDKMVDKLEKIMNNTGKVVLV
jgi:hypothetical protein